VRISSDRALYLSRIILEGLRANPRLVARGDEDTLRRAINREISEVAAELEAIEEKTRAALEKRKGQTRDHDLLYARALEDALRRHGA
jgi:hypothetical protein